MIADKLLEYSESDFLPMHMPGHKRNIEKFEYLEKLTAKTDVTEIDSFDDLNCAEGIFLDSERAAAKLWGSDCVFYSVNGSTCGILATVRAAVNCEYSRKLLIARGCHKAVYHAAELCGCECVYIETEVTKSGFNCAVSPSRVRECLEKNPDSAAVVITSPTYEGIISDVESIAEICHAFGVPLIVDEAHGAHLGLHGIFPKSAVQCKADAVIQSIHKTLPSLTQCALVHINGEAVSPEKVKRQMAIFQSSSPSYILSASIDGAVRYLASEKGEALLKEWYNSVIAVRKKLPCLYEPNKREAFDYDVSKLVFETDGVYFANTLREKYNIELELASLGYAVAMTGAGDTEETLRRFERAVNDLCPAKAQYDLEYSYHVLKSKMKISAAVIKETAKISLDLAAGRVCGESIIPYPPGIPLALPGEVLDRKAIGQIKLLLEKGCNVRGISDGKISVICED